MTATSSALKLARSTSIVALCLWAAPAFAQGAGMGGTGGAGAGGSANPGGAGSGGAASGAGGQGGETAAGGMSGAGGAGGAAGMSGSAGAAGTGGSGETAGFAGMSSTGGSAGSSAGTSGSGGTAGSSAGTSGLGGAAGAAGMSGNLITNGTFDTTSTSPWWGHVSSTPENPADQTLAVTNGQLCATMAMGGGKNVWDVLIGYSNVALLQNQHYRISFAVASDADRTIKFKVGLGDVPYTDYFIKSIPITPTLQTIEYTYLNLRADATAQFQFQIGGTPGTVCVDNVVLEPVAAPTPPVYTTPATSGHAFKDYKAMVKMGTAVDTPIFLSSPLHNAIVAGEFSAITPANSMKMNLIQPTQGVFDFTDTDALLAWAQMNGLEFRGHPLVWHTQVPAWLNDGVFDRAQMLDIMYAHIDTVVARYAGKLPYWDVVNEAINEVEGNWTYRSTIWHDRIGPDFLDLAFVRARAADASAKLLYNDYNIEQMGNAKADYVFNMISGMKQRGVPIDAVGLQSHYYVEPDGTSTRGVPNMQAIRDNIARYAAIGVEVHITECDFRIGKPLDETKTQHQTKFFAELLQICIDAPNCSHFTVWGLSDVDSWVPSTFKDYDYAHIFDSQLMPKPSYFAMSEVLAQYNTDGTPINGGVAGAAGAAGGPAPSPSSDSSAEEEGGCSLSPRASGTAPWLLAGFALLGLHLSRRRSKSARR